ncbi:MAG TPA: class I adenylate-forming enzyme family protein [Acidimicrobiales bacterium]
MTTFTGPPLDTATGIGALTLGGFLSEVCATHADREALVFDDPLRDGTTVRWTYRDLEREARAVAAGLVARGVGHSTRVGVVMGNRPEFIAAVFGIALAGGVAVPLSTFSTTAELRVLLERAAVAGVLTQTRLLDVDLADDISALVGDPELAFLGWSAAVGDHSWEQLIADGAPHADIVEHRAASIGPGDPGLIQFSSGTTSTPKGVVHLHRAPALQFWLQAGIFRRTTESRVWAPLPMFWTAGFCTAMGSTLAGGGCFVLQETFDADEALRLLARERVTEPYTLPHQARALAEHPDWESTDLSALREVYGKSVFTRHPSVEGDTTWTMPIGYGMSETCAIVATHQWHDTRETMKASTGRLLPGVRLRVVDPDTGVTLGPDQDGEFALAGPTLMDRYVGMQREECFDAEGFFRTGDVGYVDSAGELHWTGRRTEMIKTAGANVSPAELEFALRASPAVRRARVVGLPDERLGEIVTLCVEPADNVETSEDELKAFLAERVARYKVPRIVLFFAAGELPTTGSDAKVRDDVLIAMATARLDTNRSPASNQTEDAR